MENTSQLKASFLGSYMFCEVEWLRESDNVWITAVLTPSDFSFLLSKNCRLKAKPLSEISDEDAQKLGFENKDEFLHYISYESLFLQSDADKLRELGYLIGFHSLTPDQIIEYGWVKV